MVKCPNCWGNSAYDRKDGSIRCRSCGFDGHTSSCTGTTEETYNKLVGCGLIFQVIVVAVLFAPYIPKSGNITGLIIAEIFLFLIGIFVWKFLFMVVITIIDSREAI